MTPLRILAIAVAALAGIGIFVLPRYLVADTAAGAGSPDRASTERIVRDYLLANPQILREVAEKLREQDEKKADEARADVFRKGASDIYDSPHQVVLGNPNGDVTLVEFFDYNCGYCKQALADTEELLKADPKLRLVLKEFPVLGQDSVDAARVAVALYSQAPDKYLEFHRRLLSAESASAEVALGIAKDVGVDTAKLSAALADPKIEQNLVAVQRLAKSLGINGTPTYVIADRVLPGVGGADTLKDLIANVRKCGEVGCS
ncbi:outer membrane protein [Terrihabitans soli]|uniref:Outer membrane protein n=1 Tax=Terrihabitans soli TaxID=708113 RepID=A0A6S6QVQ1_9HYPH|nr:DsbA family protein [Terrihabitans soli]BCJ91100.1 outer membrane protein [Terrihabitans soli]